MCLMYRFWMQHVTDLSGRETMVRITGNNYSNLSFFFVSFKELEYCAGKFRIFLAYAEHLATTMQV